MAILNYTTQIETSKTIAEIQQCLAKNGARKIISDYDSNGIATGITFHIELKGNPIYFTLPCNHEGVLATMKKQRVGRQYLNTEQAQRTAWRIVKTWVEAQMAIIEAGLATLPEVMLPYAILKDGQTLYKRIESDRTLLLN